MTVVVVWDPSTLIMMVAIVAVGDQPEGSNSGPVDLEDEWEY